MPQPTRYKIGDIVIDTVTNNLSTVIDVLVDFNGDEYYTLELNDGTKYCRDLTEITNQAPTATVFDASNFSMIPEALQDQLQEEHERAVYEAQIEAGIDTLKWVEEICKDIKDTDPTVFPPSPAYKDGYLRACQFITYMIRSKKTELENSMKTNPEEESQKALKEAMDELSKALGIPVDKE